MKKILGFLGGIVAVFLFASLVTAKAPSDTCTYITDGTIPYPAGYFLEGEYYMPGYDIFGYNYQAHIFNGSYANAYLDKDDYSPYTGDDASYLADNVGADSTWYWQFRNIQLQMKWNDAWLANKDCETYGALDRHFGFDTYQGSGAWLTNHASGTYTSAVQYDWDLTGTYTFYIHFSGHDYYYDVDLTQSGSAITGTLTDTYLPVQYPNKDLPVTGSVSGSDITLDVVYPDAYWGTRTFVGTINGTGALSGTWSDSGTDGSSGSWSSTGNAAKVYLTCTVSDFVKIVAAPPDATKEGDNWVAADGTVIGPIIWGDFAIIQEKASDPCDEYGVINFLSPLRAGLGNWSY